MRIGEINTSKVTNTQASAKIWSPSWCAIGTGNDAAVEKLYKISPLPPLSCMDLRGGGPMPRALTAADGTLGRAERAGNVRRRDRIGILDLSRGDDSAGPNRLAGEGDAVVCLPPCVDIGRFSARCCCRRQAWLQ